MPNRIIKESICYSEDIENLEQAEEIFFYRLLVNCDDYGRCDARLPMLKSRLYPIKENVTSDDIVKCLVKLSERKMIQIYECKGIKYLQLVNWDKHQQVRAKRSKYPDPHGEYSVLISLDITCNQKISYVPVIQSNPIQSVYESESESNHEEPVPILEPMGGSLTKSKIFKPPTLDELKAYCIERKNTVDPNTFIDFYSCKGWMVGKNKMKDWKAAVRTWEKNRNGGSQNGNNTGRGGPYADQYADYKPLTFD